MSPPSLPELSAGFRRLPEYALAEVPAKVRRLRAAGIDVIDLGAGDSDLAPPPAAVEALERAAADPAFSRYAFQSGLPAFRVAVAEWTKERFGVELDPDRELVPLLGSKEGIAKLPLAFVDPGDLAVVPDPGYAPYQGGVLLAGGGVHRMPLRAGDDFLLRVEEIPSDVVSRAKLLYLNYPNNPTAAVAPRSYLEEVVAFCREHGLVLVYDLAYSEVAFDGYRPPSILEVEGARDVAVEFHSFSKTFNMTGWRLGWAAGGAQLVGTLTRVKTFMDTGPFLALQAAGAAVLTESAAWVRHNVETFRRRRDAAVEALRSSGFGVDSPRATLYLWVPVPDGESASSFGRRALEEQGVVVLPGSALGEGGEGYVRIALTVPEDRLREGVGRLGHLQGR